MANIVDGNILSHLAKIVPDSIPHPYLGKRICSAVNDLTN